MQIRYLLALSLLPNLVLADEATPSQASSSQTDEVQCVIVPPVAQPQMKTAQENQELQEIEILSQRSEAELGNKAKFIGDVHFNQGNRHIAADTAVLDQANEQLDANGNLVFQDERFTVTADSLSAKMKDNSAKLKGAQYWLHGQQVHGDAEQLEITEDNNLLLTDTNFTTCPPDNVSWLLEANEIKIDSEEEWGEIWNAKLKIADVPVLYIPYMTVPVSEKRKSGLLFPKFSTSTTNGVEFALPYYWNIAPEYDLTLTPHYMSSRGLFLKSEFRYLAGDDQQGQLNVEFLADDKKLTGSPNRYLYHWQHQGKLDENWRVNAKITDISDNNYFNDLTSDVNRSTDNQLSRIGEMSYLEKNWDFNVRVQDIKVLGTNEEPYRVLPQVSYNYREQNFWQGLSFDFNSEATNFEHKNSGFNRATRLHIEPSISLPIHTPAGSFTAEAKVLQTNYWQDEKQLTSTATNTTDTLDKTVNRTIPQLKVHAQANFERKVVAFQQDYRQTLEPQIQYLYVGYEDQSKIGLYDTAIIQEDYYGLFRDRRFSGLDRIADANQLTYGLTTRLYDEHNVEEFKFSLGQIVYFQDSRVQLNEEITTDNPSSSILAAELDAHLYQDWFMSGAIQLDTKRNDTQKSEITLDFRPSTNKLFQLSYRYVPDLLNATTNESVTVSQTGFRLAWPLTDSTYFVGNWYYDLNEKRAAEVYAGLQYESCCWAARFSYQYKIKTNYDDFSNPVVETRELFETGFYLNFVIKGLGGSGPLGVSDMLNEGLFNYRKPLYLRN